MPDKKKVFLIDYKPEHDLIHKMRLRASAMD